MALEEDICEQFESWVYDCYLADPNNQKQREPDGKIPLKFQVADIQLAFDNKQMLNLLEKRANALKAQNFEQVTKIQREMTEYKNKNLEKLITPKYFFATLRTEEAFLIANKVDKFPYMGAKINLSY